MFTRKELEELVHSDTDNSPVLSLYLSTDLSKHHKEERRLALRKLLEGFGQQAKQDVERIHRFFDQEYDWKSQGVGLFTSSPAGFWKTIRLAVPVFDYATFEAHPNVRPLANALDEHECYGIVLVDRECARFFAVQLGEIAEYEHVFPPVPGRQKQGRWMAPHIQHHIEALAFKNLQQAARLTSDFYKSCECSRLLVAGTDDVIAQFREILPKSLAKKIAGDFSMDAHASDATILARAQGQVASIEREQERQLVDSLVSARSKKNPTAVLGLSDTCGALMEGSIRELVTEANYRAPGYVCSHCSFLSVQELARCPLCGCDMQRVDSLVDLAVHRAIDLGSRVKVVHGVAADRLRELGSIGAFLRF